MSRGELKVRPPEIPFRLEYAFQKRPPPRYNRQYVVNLPTDLLDQAALADLAKSQLPDSRVKEYNVDALEDLDVYSPIIFWSEITRMIGMMTEFTPSLLQHDTIKESFFASSDASPEYSTEALKLGKLARRGFISYVGYESSVGMDEVLWSTAQFPPCLAYRHEYDTLGVLHWHLIRDPHFFTHTWQTQLIRTWDAYIKVVTNSADKPIRRLNFMGFFYDANGPVKEPLTSNFVKGKILAALPPPTLNSSSFPSPGPAFDGYIKTAWDNVPVNVRNIFLADPAAARSTHKIWFGPFQSDVYDNHFLGVPPTIHNDRKLNFTYPTTYYTANSRFSEALPARFLSIEWPTRPSNWQLQDVSQSLVRNAATYATKTWSPSSLTMVSESKGSFDDPNIQSDDIYAANSAAAHTFALTYQGILNDYTQYYYKNLSPSNILSGISGNALDALVGSDGSLLDKITFAAYCFSGTVNTVVINADPKAYRANVISYGVDTPRESFEPGFLSTFPTLVYAKTRIISEQATADSVMDVTPILIVASSNSTTNFAALKSSISDATMGRWSCTVINQSQQAGSLFGDPEHSNALGSYDTIVLEDGFTWQATTTAREYYDYVVKLLEYAQDQMPRVIVFEPAYACTVLCDLPEHFLATDFRVVHNYAKVGRSAGFSLVVYCGVSDGITDRSVRAILDAVHNAGCFVPYTIMPNDGNVSSGSTTSIFSLNSIHSVDNTGVAPGVLLQVVPKVSNTVELQQAYSILANYCSFVSVTATNDSFSDKFIVAGITSANRLAVLRKNMGVCKSVASKVDTSKLPVSKGSVSFTPIRSGPKVQQMGVHHYIRCFMDRYRTANQDTALKWKTGHVVVGPGDMMELSTVYPGDLTIYDARVIVPEVDGVLNERETVELFNIPGMANGMPRGSCLTILYSALMQGGTQEDLIAVIDEVTTMMSQGLGPDFFIYNHYTLHPDVKTDRYIKREGTYNEANKLFTFGPYASSPAMEYAGLYPVITKDKLDVFDVKPTFLDCLLGCRAHGAAPCGVSPGHIVTINSMVTTRIVIRDM